MRSTPPARLSSGGFTLLETIVTLVIVSMIVVVLMQALQQSLGLRTRLLRHEREVRAAVLQEQWFRESVGSAIADLPDALGAMDGNARGLSLVSAAPLSGPGLSKLYWSLQPVPGGVALAYSEAGGKPMTILAGPLTDAAFDYLDGEGRWLQEWKVPPVAETAAGANEMLPREVPDQLPRMVRLHATTPSGNELMWLVAIAASPRPPRVLRPEEYGLGL